MPTPIETLEKLVRKVQQCDVGAQFQDILDEAKAVIMYNGWIGREIAYHQRRGRIAEIVKHDEFLCVFGTDKLILTSSQFSVSDPVAGPVSGPVSIPMILNCPACGERHVDSGRWEKIVHSIHACQHCGLVWRPAKVPTVGVQFLPGCKGE